MVLIVVIIVGMLVIPSTLGKITEKQQRKDNNIGLIRNYIESAKEKIHGPEDNSGDTTTKDGNPLDKKPMPMPWILDMLKALIATLRLLLSGGGDWPF